MQPIFALTTRGCSLDQLAAVVSKNQQIELAPDAISAIKHCRAFLEEAIQIPDKKYYGINTGFGSLCDIQISDAEIDQLQLNLVRSHACGTGDYVPDEVIKLILLTKVQSLCIGHSGVRLELVQRLVDLYNHDVLPEIFQQGSLGASGDLAPLAHVGLAIIGEGKVKYKGQWMPTRKAYQELAWQPIQLKAKEGLAILNGTQFSLAYGAWACLQADQLWSWANRCAALSHDAFLGRMEPFDDRLHQVRPHEGQLQAASAMRALLNGSELAAQKKETVQDPYAFRCVPQVHGASRDAIDYVKKVVNTELRSVTDNPNLFPDSDGVLSGGNFHAQPLALALDFMGIALAELGSISERRVYQLISGTRRLPAFLTKNAGLNSGLMIPQYTAASIVSQNKQLCTPASVDSIVSSNGQEDHVSMAANAATKLYKITENVERLLAIEWMTAAQALHFRRPYKTSAFLEHLIMEYREIVPPLGKDRVLSKDIHKTITFLREASISEAEAFSAMF